MDSNPWARGRGDYMKKNISLGIGLAVVIFLSGLLGIFSVSYIGNKALQLILLFCYSAIIAAGICWGIKRVISSSISEAARLVDLMAAGDLT